MCNHGCRIEVVLVPGIRRKMLSWMMKWIIRSCWMVRGSSGNVRVLRRSWRIGRNTILFDASNGGVCSLVSKLSRCRITRVLEHLAK